MKVNEIKSYSKLEQTTTDLGEISSRISSTLGKINNVYENQSAGYSSASSTKQSQSMMNYTEEAQKIAKNINSIGNTVRSFKRTTQNIDEAK